MNKEKYFDELNSIFRNLSGFEFFNVTKENELLVKKKFIREFYNYFINWYKIELLIGELYNLQEYIECNLNDTKVTANAEVEVSKLITIYEGKSCRYEEILKEWIKVILTQVEVQKFLNNVLIISQTDLNCFSKIQEEFIKNSNLLEVILNKMFQELIPNIKVEEFYKLFDIVLFDIVCEEQKQYGKQMKINET